MIDITKNTIPISKGEKILQPKKNNELEIFLKEKTWTTETPTQPGYYWAYENLEECDADVLSIYVTETSLKENKCLCLDVISDLSEFSHFIGPLKIPNAPLDCAIISATGIDKDGNVFEVKKRTCDDKWSIIP